MKMSFAISKQIRPMLRTPPVSNRLLRPAKEKVVVVMGATGTGKTRLSIDLAGRFDAEIINSDKIQVHQGLHITTNKITDEESRGVPHHLLGVVAPDSDFSAADFRDAASVSIRSILNRDRLPVIVGGSNSFVDALVDADFQSEYSCCFLWVDAAMPVLHSHVSRRVDGMLEKGMVEELRDFYDPDADNSRGVRRAIGVSELSEYFRVEPFCSEERSKRFLEEGIHSIKINTWRLAQRQLEKIRRLKNARGWNVHRFDATDVFQKRGLEADIAWDKAVKVPVTALVNSFLYDLKPTYRRSIIGQVAHSMMAAASY